MINAICDVCGIKVDAPDAGPADPSKAQERAYVAPSSWKRYGQAYACSSCVARLDAAERRARDAEIRLIQADNVERLTRHGVKRLEEGAR